MLLHHDLAWWAFVLSLAALVGAYPLSLLANLTSPAIENWWAERSVASTRKRIGRLEKQLVEYEQFQELGELEELVLKAIGGIGSLVVFCIELLAILTLLQAVSDPVIGHSHELAPPDIRFVLVMLGAIAAISGYLVQFLVLEKLGRFRKKRSPIDRKTLKNAIETLKAKLAGIN